MKRNSLKQMYYKETFEHWKDRVGNPTLEYTRWVEDKLMDKLEEN
jgi:hypothetical protein